MKENNLTSEASLDRLYDMTSSQLMEVAVDIRENTGRYREGQLDIVKAALEKILDIRYAERLDVHNYYYSAKQRLFVDMDGTLATFTPVDRLETLYEKGYFTNLRPLDNVVLAVKDIIKNNPDIEVYILSAYLSDSAFALEEKNRWLDQHLPEIDQAHRIFPPCGTDKKDYIPNGIRSTDCLLDDYTHNLTLWQPPARGIKLLNGINHTQGTWKRECVRYDLKPQELADRLTGIMRSEHVSERPQPTPVQEKVTVNQFASQLDECLHTAVQDKKALAELLKSKLQFGNISLEGVAAIKLQRPDARFVAGTQDWRKLGYRLKPGEFANAIKVITSYKEQSFVVNGKTIPTAQATDAERQQILTGELPVQETIKTKMQLVYDVTQTDCPPAEYDQLGRPDIHNLAVEQRHTLLREMMRDKGIDYVGDRAMTILDATGYYDAENNAIHINENLKDYQKLAAYCESCAAAIVENTTTHTGPEQDFEVSYLALQLKRLTGVQIDDAKYGKASELYARIPAEDQPVQALDHMLARCQRAAEYVGSELQGRYRTLMQSQGVDLSMLNNQVAQNFIQDLS